MSSLKSFLSITLFSLFMASVVILLGVKYHWGEYIQKNHRLVVDLSLPKPQHLDVNPEVLPSIQGESTFVPQILDDKRVNTLLASMNKEQVEEHCINLFSRNIKDSLMLELATANCVLSNYQEVFQNAEGAVNPRIELTVIQQCSKQFSYNSRYSETEMQLLLGICVSDRLSTN